MHECDGGASGRDRARIRRGGRLDRVRRARTCHGNVEKLAKSGKSVNFLVFGGEIYYRPPAQN